MTSIRNLKRRAMARLWFDIAYKAYVLGRRKGKL